MKIPQQIKNRIEIPHDPTIPHLGICPKTTKLSVWKTHILMFIAASYTITMIWKQPKFPPGMNQEDYTHI